MLAINLDENKGLPLYRQLYAELRESILSGRIGPGQKLPSTRVLADHLQLSRNTVSQAYAELESEGYLTGRHGSGSYASLHLPEERLPAAAVPGGSAATSSARTAGRFRLRRTVSEDPDRSLKPPAGLPFDFDPGQGAWDVFPRQLWKRLLGRQWGRGWEEAMGYGDPGGYRPLKEEVAGYLSRSRAVRCSPDQVVIVNGTQQALDLLARLLLVAGDLVAVENPGYSAAREVFASYGAVFQPVTVDHEGMVVDELQGGGARLVLVSPSHQFPTGETLSLRRRLSLLAWAGAEDALVIEDDYDSEFRFEGRPLSSLQGLDRAGSVVYLGSFSRLLFPSLRVGYAVLPPDLVGPFERAKDLTDRQTPILEQQVLADFLGEGHFEHHLRRMRKLYGERRMALEDALRDEMGELGEMVGTKAGMHLMVRLRLSLGEPAIVARAAREGVAVYPASPFYCGPSPMPALVMGYAAVPPERIREGVRRLAGALRGLM